MKGGLPLNNLPNDFLPNHDLTTFNWNINKDELPNNISPILTSNGTFVHISETESFIHEETGEELTFLKMLKAAIPDIQNCLRTPVQPPPKFFIFSPSGRNRLIRAWQASQYLPPTTPKTKLFSDAFHKVSNLDNYWHVSSQYTASLWASSGNEDRAVSLIIHYGWTPNFDQKTTDIFQYRMNFLPHGVAVEIDNSLSINERVHAACVAALQAYQLGMTNQIKLQSVAVKRLFLIDDVYLNLPSEVTAFLKSLLIEYITTLKSHLANGSLPPIPQCDNIMPTQPNDTFIIPFADFNAKSRLLKAENGKTISKKELISQGFSEYQIKKLVTDGKIKKINDKAKTAHYTVLSADLPIKKAAAPKTSIKRKTATNTPIIEKTTQKVALKAKTVNIKKS